MGAARAVVERVRRAAGADGAGESGLSALIGTHALHAAGDALIAVALAGTVFFAVPLGEARGRVALYLLLTLLPFSLLVPVAGPVLDHFRHGRRTVLAVTTAGRGLIAWSMVGATGGLAIYPLALAVLVLSRAYGVARSAATPRVRPPGVSLVAANARLNVAAVVSAAAAAAVGAGTARLVGLSWVLRLGSLVLLAAAVLALRLPGHVDEVRGPRQRRVRYRLLEAPGVVQRPLAAAVALRAQAGLLTIFLAFLLKREGAAPVVVVTVLGAAVAGQLLGTVLASRLPDTVTARLTWAAMIGPGVACAVAAVVGGAALEALAVGTAGMGSALSKFASDAALQTHVPRASTSGAFARSETALQLSWALAGAVGLALPGVAAAGFGVAAALPALGLVAGARVAAGRPLLPRRGGGGGGPARSRAEAPAEGPAPRGDGSPSGLAASHLGRPATTGAAGPGRGTRAGGSCEDDAPTAPLPRQAGEAPTTGGRHDGGGEAPTTRLPAGPGREQPRDAPPEPEAGTRPWWVDP